MFHLTTHSAKLSHINVREEKHGDESVPAVDLRIALSCPNDFLAYLHPDLKASLYRAEHDQGALIEDAGYLPRLRFEQMPEIRWTMLMKADVVLHGAKPKDDIALLEVEVDKVVLSPMDGGTVGVQFRVRARPSATIVAKLYSALGVDGKVSVTPIEPGEGSLGDHMDKRAGEEGGADDD